MFLGYALHYFYGISLPFISYVTRLINGTSTNQLGCISWDNVDPSYNYFQTDFKKTAWPDFKYDRGHWRLSLVYEGGRLFAVDRNDCQATLADGRKATDISFALRESDKGSGICEYDFSAIDIIFPENDVVLALCSIF